MTQVALVPFSTPIQNPQSIALLNRVPYLTVGEFQEAPTALDLTNLVAGGTVQDQTASLAQIIARASSWIDQVVFPIGTGGTLAASIDTDAGYVPTNNGVANLICRFKPIIAITQVAFGATPTTLASISDTLGADIVIEGRVLKVPFAWGTQSRTRWGLGAGTGQVYAQWSYIDGYPHTTLAADLDAADTAITVNSTLGMFAGTSLMIYDGSSTEEVVVATVDSATTFTTTEGVLFAHTVPAYPDGITVSALPPAVKEAAIRVTVALIKQRGDDSIVLPDESTGVPAVAHGSADEDLAVAMEILEPFRIVAGAT